MDEQIMLLMTKFVTANYEGLYEIYTTQINQDEMTFDEFCVKMYINNLKNNIDETKNL
jgi:hypothetical protein